METENSAEERDDAVSDHEALLEFVYLTPVGVVKFRPNGEIQLINPVAAQLLMPLAPEAELSNLYRVLSAAMPDLRYRIDRFSAYTGSVCDQMQIKVPRVPTIMTLSINKIDPATFMAVFQDVTHAVRQEARLREDQERFRAIFENIRDYAIYTVDPDGRIDTWNQTLARVGGWEPADVVGAPNGVVFPPDPVSQTQSVSMLEHARQRGMATLEGWRMRKDGSRFWGETVASSLPDPDGRVSGFVLIMRDLTDRKQMEDRLVELSVTDPMTGAFNRRAGENKLAESYEAWLRRGVQFSLLMIDCDHFKSINDKAGHDAGDAVLIALVRICQSKLRAIDTIFRWGGEEFMVLLPESNGKSACMVAERLRLALEAEEVLHPTGGIRFTVSIGIAEVSGADNTADDVLRRSDQALYCAKNSGRNLVRLDGLLQPEPNSVLP